MPRKKRVSGIQKTVTLYQRDIERLERVINFLDKDPNWTHSEADAIRRMFRMGLESFENLNLNQPNFAPCKKGN